MIFHLNTYTVEMPEIVYATKEEAIEAFKQLLSDMWVSGIYFLCKCDKAALFPMTNAFLLM
jgi:hypothetical protein